MFTLDALSPDEPSCLFKSLQSETGFQSVAQGFHTHQGEPNAFNAAQGLHALKAPSNQLQPPFSKFIFSPSLPLHHQSPFAENSTAAPPTNGFT